MRRLIDVRAAFDRVENTGKILRIDRTGTTFPKGGHFQGVQVMGGRTNRIFLTSSSRSQAYLVTCRLEPFAGKQGRVERVTTLSQTPLDHAGGFQRLARFIAIGVEDDRCRRDSDIQFWQTRGAKSLRQLDDLTISRSGAKNVSTAGAVGIGTVGKRTLLAVSTWHAETIDFYRANGNPFQDRTRRFRFWRTWRKRDADKSGWIDRNFGNYQQLNLVVDQDDQLFMIAFNRSSGGDDFMDLYGIDLRSSTPPSKMLRKIAKKHMICKGGADLSKAAGIFVRSRRKFLVYAAKGASGDNKTGTTITLNYFSAN